MLDSTEPSACSQDNMSCRWCRWKTGLRGAALAFVLANGTSTVLLLAYVIWRDVRARGTAQSTWPGLGKGALQGWGSYLSYGVPAAAMICMEWWCYEVVIFMAGGWGCVTW